MSYRSRTVSRPVVFRGLGLHSGIPVTVTVHPASSGIFFRCGNDRIQAIPENVTDTKRCTRLGTISTIEHLMSAFAGLEITDAEVELTAPELPGMDGSARPYTSGLKEAGFVEGDERTIPSLYRRVFLHEGECKIAVAKGGGHWRYTYDAGVRWPGVQAFEVQDVSGSYSDQVAPARTFVLSEELSMVQAAGLGKGLDETSALILGPDGYLNEPRFVDEAARHKLLDLMGDLYLAGVPIKFLNVVAEKSGHTTNVMAAAMLKAAL